MDTIIYKLQDRGYWVIYHWFYLILAGLRHLEKDNTKINVYMPWYTDCKYNTESLKYFEDKFNFIFKLDQIKSHKLIDFDGEPLITPDSIAPEGYKYIRNKLLKNKNYKIIPNMYVYITRKGSENLESNNGKLTTCANRGIHHSVINEDSTRDILAKYGVSVIRLEDLSLEEKIKLFCEAEIIISPVGGGLTLTALCNPTQKVIELASPNAGLHHYEVICKVFNVPYIRFSDVDYTDSSYNISININKFENCLNTVLKKTTNA